MKEKELLYLSAFIQITRRISSSLHLKEVLSLIVKNICEITGSKGCTLLLLDEEGQNLEIKASYGLSDQYLKKGPISADRSIPEALGGDPVIIEDAATDSRVQYPQEARQEGIASIATFPILVKDRVIGVLRLYMSVPCKFTEDDIEFLSAVAIQSGLAIENARLYEQAHGNVP